jgi:hypothetical protein
MMMATAAAERKKADNHATRRERKVPRHLQGQERLKIRGSLPEYMSCLPNEVWAMIIDFLDKKDLLLMSSVSVDWRWLALSHYRHHKVRSCDDLIGQLDFLSANCPHLDSLVLTGWWSVGMGDEFKHLPASLTHLDISNSQHVLDAHLSLLPRSLRSLNLSGCHNITNQGMSLLPPALEHLDISECFLVSDIGLRNLSGVVGRTRDEIEEEERERARLVAEQQQREEEEAERRRRKGKAKLDDDADAIQSELESPLDFAPEVIAALPDLVSDDEDADEESTAQQPQPQPTEPEPEPAAGDVGRQLLPVVDNPPFPHLTSLLLHKCFAISSLDFLPRTLEELDISHLNLNFAGRCFTSLPPTIKKLTVTDCRVSDDSLWDLPPSLVYLDLTQCYFITDSGLQALYGMPYLKTLVVRACSRIYGDGLVSLPASLEQLVLSQTNIADESLDTLPASIKKLDLSFTSITNRALLHLPPNLEELNVGWCKHIDDEGLAALPLTLRALGLEDNIKNISDQALVHLYNRHSKSLRVLNLVGCDRITDEGLRYLPRNLTTLCLTLRPANISKNAMKKLQLSGRMELKVMESHRRKILLQAAKAK